MSDRAECQPECVCVYVSKLIEMTVLVSQTHCQSTIRIVFKLYDN